MSDRLTASSRLCAVNLLPGSSLASADQSRGRRRVRSREACRQASATATALTLSLRDAIDRGLGTTWAASRAPERPRCARSAAAKSEHSASRHLGDVCAVRGSRSPDGIGFQREPSRDQPAGRSSGPSASSTPASTVSQQVFNWSAIQQLEIGGGVGSGVTHSYRSDAISWCRSQATPTLSAISDHATVSSTASLVETAKALHDRAVDQNKAGVVASIDVLRAHVELQTEQQRLIAAENQLAIDKLALARVIGLPNGQEFRVTDAVPFAPLEGITVDQALDRAYASRPDYLSARAQVRAAELARRSAAAANYPSLAAGVNYGAIGSPNLDAARETFSVALTLTVPIFQGTRVRADTLQADAALQRAGPNSLISTAGSTSRCGRLS